MRATCNSCDHQFSVSSNVAGKRVRCPECGEAVRVSEGDDGPSRSSSRSKKSRGRSSGGDQTGLIVGAGLGGAAVVGILVFVLTRSGSAPLPPPPDQPAAGATAQMSTPAATPGAQPVAQANTVPAVAQNPDGLPTAMIQQLKDATVFIKIGRAHV